MREIFGALLTRARARGRRTLQALLAWAATRHLPGPTVLPIAGAVVGLYCGLAAGVFARLIGVVSALTVELPTRLAEGRPEEPGAFLDHLWTRAQRTDWHLEYAIVGVPLAAGALLLARLIPRGGTRDLARSRLRIQGLLILGALALYYPLVALTVLGAALGHAEGLLGVLRELPWQAKLLMPALGGALVGRLLRDRPETHGHGVPEVVLVVQREREGLPLQGGLYKMGASALTIGSGGSAGREGPIVYTGAAFGSAVGRILGFDRKELSILLACGAGGGIAASFDTPMAGALFAMEIILREFELRVFSPIILASVTATLVGRGVLGEAAIVRRVPFEMASSWEIVAYVGLGLLCGLLAYAFIQALHASERLFSGGYPNPLSRALGRRPLWQRAALGGFLSGTLVLVSPPVWGTGHEYLNLAAAGRLGLGVLLLACVAKLVATALTIGSGGSGGTFFPAAVIGAMAGGAFGELLRLAFGEGIRAGSFALVGMSGVVAGLTRGPLTAMMMLYELARNVAVVLPAMVTAAIASALCHLLVERRAPKVRTDREILRSTPAAAVAEEVPLLPAHARPQEMLERLLDAEEGALPVLDAGGRLGGLVQLGKLRELWRDESLQPLLVADDLVAKVEPLGPDQDLAAALEAMDAAGVNTLPLAEGAGAAEGMWRVVTRSAIQRRLAEEHSRDHHHGKMPVAASELSDGPSD